MPKTQESKQQPSSKLLEQAKGRTRLNAAILADVRFRKYL